MSGPALATRPVYFRQAAQDPQDERTDVLGRLRAMQPIRPLGGHLAFSIAERQAQALRSQLGTIGPKLDERPLEEIEWLTVSRRPFPSSGMATNVGSGWIVVLNEDEPKLRQRFTLAHEIKHILDDHAASLLKKRGLPLYQSSAGYSSDEQAERVADRFAAALLMPRPLLRADWADGIQDVARLAARYGTSRQAMNVRLSQLGLIENRPRCQSWQSETDGES